MRDYQNLLVWRESMNLVKTVYMLTAKLPKEEKYSLTDQMRRAAVSIPSNIAEGHDRHSDREMKHFLSIAKGSAAELMTQLMIAESLGYLSKEETENALDFCDKIRAQLYNFIIRLANA